MERGDEWMIEELLNFRGFRMEISLELHLRASENEF
jgi:hypothetical protein